MTYNVRGSITFTLTEDEETAFVLGFSTFLTSLESTWRFEYWREGLENPPTDRPLLRHVLEYFNFVLVEETEDEQGRTDLYYQYSFAWEGARETALMKYLASVGIGMQGAFIAEDDESWHYVSDYRSFVIDCDDLKRIPRKRLVALETLEKTLKEILASEADSDTKLAEIRDILAVKKS